MASTDDDPTLIWLRPEPSGRKPRFTRAEIARAAVGIADAEGFDAVTMKRIANELGAGTMTLYYYVRNKADIVALMQDSIFEDVLIAAGELPPDWRQAVALIARRTRDVLTGHPWAVSSLNQAQFGPNAMQHYDQSLAALAGTTLSYPDKIEVTAIFDDYVAGNAAHTIETRDRLRMTADNPGLVAEAQSYGEELMSTGKFPELEALALHAREAAATGGGDTAGGDAPGSDAADATRGGAGPAANLDRQFEIGLSALLDGIAQRYGIP